MPTLRGDCGFPDMWRLIVEIPLRRAFKTFTGLRPTALAGRSSLEAQSFIRVTMITMLSASRLCARRCAKYFIYKTY